MASTDSEHHCGGCGKSETEAGKALKNCAKCKTTPYCSRDCQKTNWKQHKKVCAALANANANAGAPANASARRESGTTSSSSNANTRGDSGTTNSSSTRNRSKGLEFVIAKPFHKLNDKTWLHGRPEEDVYKLLIDAYRLRMEDQYKFEGEVDEDSIYGGAPNSVPGFRRFLRQVERKRELLPSWWSPEKSEACVRFGSEGNWSDLARAVEKSDIIKHYGDSLIPMQLRLFGEQIFGSTPGGNLQGKDSGKRMIEAMMMQESGAFGSTIDMSNMFSSMGL